jgi:DNA-binding GntR family transcriptional regulator
VLEALAKKDPAAARRAIERDIRNTAAFLLKSSTFRSTSGPLTALRGEMRSVA